MGAQVVDYRVSTLVVLCKDCGHDVGLYPARHKCQPVERPAMPALPAQYTKSNVSSPPSLDLNARTMSSGSNSSMASSSPSPSFSSVEGGSASKWSSSRHKTNMHVEDNEESVYFNNFAANLPGSSTNESTTATTLAGKKLWGKVRQNEKWKQLSEKNDKPKQSGKLWGKLMQATQTMADKIPSKDDRGAESDEDDWEGETHVSRILREYYEKKRMRLPPWLFDDDVQMKRQPSSRRNREPLAAMDSEEPRASPMRTPSRRRLWEQDPDDPKQISSRERERQELRQAPIKQQSEERYHNEYRDENDRYSSNHRREEDRYGNRDYGQRPREEDRYNSNRNYTEDRYYSNDYEPPRRKSRDQPRYEQDYHYAQSRARSPPRSTRSNSTSRQPRYDTSGYDDRSYYQPKSERSTRGYADRYEENHRAADLDDYYHNSHSDHTRHHNIPSASRDRAARYHTSPTEASSRSGGRRYGNDPGYF